MAARINKEKCTGCGKCINACPADAITLKDNIAIVNKIIVLTAASV